MDKGLMEENGTYGTPGVLWVLFMKGWGGFLVMEVV